jgi:two-component system response regulator DctR
MTLALPPELGLPMVYLVDDEDVVRHAVAWLLRSRRLLSTDFPSAEAFLAALPAPGAADWPASPSCVLLDLRMGGMSGIALFDELAGRGLVEALPVIFLTGHGDVPTAVATVKRGAFDFVEKPFSNNALVDRIELALAASARVLAARRERARRLKGLEQLSEREHEVMRRVAEGLPNKQIAEAMHLSVRTIEAHRAHVFEKMDVASAVDLANLLNRP